MPGGDGSSEEFVEDDSGGEEEEEEEDDGGDSSASYESDEDDEDDDDDAGATGDDSDVFETPIKARKRSRTSAQNQQQQQQQQRQGAAAASAGKNKRKSATATDAPGSTSSSSSKKKKGVAAAATGARGNGKGKAAPAAGVECGKPSPSPSPLPTGDGTTRATAGAGDRSSSGKKSSVPTSAPSPALVGVVRPAAGGGGGSGGGGGAGSAAKKPLPAKTPKAAVSDYMQQSNRPYSYINVFDNLRKKIPKPMVQKLLDELVRDGVLKMQEYGKAKIYYANQDALPNGAGDASAEKMRRLDEEAKTLTSELEIASKQEQQAKSRVHSLSSQPTDAALAERLETAARDLEQAEARNAAAKGQGRSVVAGGMKAAKSECNKFRALWVDRKRNAMDAVDMIADGMDKKPKDVMEMLGVEPDEAPIPAKM